MKNKYWRSADHNSLIYCRLGQTQMRDTNQRDTDDASLTPRHVTTGKQLETTRGPGALLTVTGRQMDSPGSICPAIFVSQVYVCTVDGNRVLRYTMA